MRVEWCHPIWPSFGRNPNPRYGGIRVPASANAVPGKEIRKARKAYGFFTISPKHSKCWSPVQRNGSLEEFWRGQDTTEITLQLNSGFPTIHSNNDRAHVWTQPPTWAVGNSAYDDTSKNSKTSMELPTFPYWFQPMINCWLGIWGLSKFVCAITPFHCKIHLDAKPTVSHHTPWKMGRLKKSLKLPFWVSRGGQKWQGWFTKCVH